MDTWEIFSIQTPNSVLWFEYVPPNSCIRSLIQNTGLLRGESFLKRWLGLEDRALMNGLIEEKFLKKGWIWLVCLCPSPPCRFLDFGLSRLQMVKTKANSIPITQSQGLYYSSTKGLRQGPTSVLVSGCSSLLLRTPVLGIRAHRKELI